MIEKHTKKEENAFDVFSLFRKDDYMIGIIHFHYERKLRQKGKEKKEKENERIRMFFLPSPLIKEKEKWRKENIPLSLLPSLPF